MDYHRTRFSLLATHEKYNDSSLCFSLQSGNVEDIEKFSKRTVKVTRQHNEDCRKLLRLMGVPVVEAPSEAEAQCAALSRTGKVYAVASEDMDSLTFGATKFLRHLMDPSSKKIPVMEFEVSKVLEGLNLTMDQFIDLCILCGCDYCDSIRGIGAQTALKLIRQHGSIENILENINKERYQIPENWPYQEARRLFKEPDVLTDDEKLDLKWSSPDEEGLMQFLVTENGFNSERISKGIEKIKAAKNKSSQGRLESFFKPSVSTSIPNKRKDLLSLSSKIPPLVLRSSLVDMSVSIIWKQGTKCVIGSLKPIIKYKPPLVQQSIQASSMVVCGLNPPSLALQHHLVLPRCVHLGA
ncbi:hypothetical protein Leryth_004277 [Lithospermum erythrorhizon]|nr:hypothetical protein Leryth_004277 [Lithospermum erythrorhizon]